MLYSRSALRLLLTSIRFGRRICITIYQDSLAVGIPKTVGLVIPPAVRPRGTARQRRFLRRGRRESVATATTRGRWDRLRHRLPTGGTRRADIGRRPASVRTAAVPRRRRSS